MSHDLVIISPNLREIGQLANSFARTSVLSEYQSRKSKNTLRRQQADLALFSRYLEQAGVSISDEILFTQAEPWAGMTFGLVDGFLRWMLREGYALGSLNVRLATIKTYCKLAAKAGVLLTEEFALIKLVTGYSQKEKRHVDEKRERVRVGDKKADPIPVSREQAVMLKTQPDTPQGRRDALLMCLLLDHGLRCGEVEGLTVSSISLEEGTLKFYREKVDKDQIHQLTPDTYKAAVRYLINDKPTYQLLMGSRKGGVLSGGMSERAITARVEKLGERCGLSGLSAHDCRHYWATSAIKGGTDIKSLQDAGGWSSPAMPLRYAESSKIANSGVKLG